MDNEKEKAMNYEWDNIVSEGQPGEGYCDVYNAIVDSISVRIIVSYFPNLKQFNKNKVCSVTAFYACHKKEITSGKFHWIMDDVVELIQEVESERYEPSMSKFNVMMTQHFFVKEMPDMEYSTHGTYSAKD